MELYGIGIVALILGVSESLKRIGLISKFIPIINLVLGLAAGFLLYGDLKQSIVTGLYIGLSASGLYSGVKNVAEGIKSQSKPKENP